MTKGKCKVVASTSSRERSLTCHENQTKFMLEWCMDYLKKQHAGFKFRKQHLMLCTDALNKKYVMGVTVDQVDRHYRYHKENWKFIAAALSKSGNAFDHTRHLLTISVSEKAKLCDRARRLLSKPIKFYNEMQELFTGSSVDGSLARDQNTCLDDSGDSESFDDTRELIDLNSYTQPEDLGEDFDTLPTPTRHANVENSSSSTTRASKKRPRGSSSPSKKQSKTKSRFAECNDEIVATMKSLRDAFQTIAPPPIPQLPTDPHERLWQRLEAIPTTLDQRVLVEKFCHQKRTKVRGVGYVVHVILL